MRRREEKREPQRPPTAADDWAEQTSEVVARAMAKWLKASINTQRPINTLNLVEMKLLARVATDAWIIEASHRVERPMTEEEKIRLEALLF